MLSVSFGFGGDVDSTVMRLETNVDGNDFVHLDFEKMQLLKLFAFNFKQNTVEKISSHFFYSLKFLAYQHLVSIFL